MACPCSLNSEQRSRKREGLQAEEGKITVPSPGGLEVRRSEGKDQSELLLSLLAD